MLKGEPDAEATADNIINELGDHALTKSHARHLSAAKCKSMGLKIRMMEDDLALQDAILTVHHACIHTLSATGAYKIIENHLGVAYMQVAQTVLMPTSTSSQGPDPI